MGMQDTALQWTAAAVRDLMERQDPDDPTRYEVVDGELLVTPAPRALHQAAATLLFTLLHPYVTEHKIGWLSWSPADIELDPKTLVQPDLYVAPLIEGRRPKQWKDIAGLRLVIEVLSPSTARSDRVVKRRRYQRAGIPEYWIVDLDARMVERWRPGDERPEVLSERLEWQPETAVAPLTIDLVRFFADVHDG